MVELNDATPGDMRDTTTPSAMLHNLRRVVLGDALFESGHRPPAADATRWRETVREATHHVWVQIEERGQWVDVGKFKANGNLTVQLLTRGQDWNNSGPTYAHHAASAIKADCTA
mgnify:CR=1 FL=1